MLCCTSIMHNDLALRFVSWSRRKSSTSVYAECINPPPARAATPPPKNVIPGLRSEMSVLQARLRRFHFGTEASTPKLFSALPMHVVPCTETCTHRRGAGMACTHLLSRKQSGPDPVARFQRRPGAPRRNGKNGPWSILTHVQHESTRLATSPADRSIDVCLLTFFSSTFSVPSSDFSGHCISPSLRRLLHTDQQPCLTRCVRNIADSRELGANGRTPPSTPTTRTTTRASRPRWAGSSTMSPRTSSSREYCSRLAL